MNVVLRTGGTMTPERHYVHRIVEEKVLALGHQHRIFLHQAREKVIVEVPNPNIIRFRLSHTKPIKNSKNITVFIKRLKKHRPNVKHLYICKQLNRCLLPIISLELTCRNFLSSCVWNVPKNSKNTFFILI